MRRSPDSYINSLHQLLLEVAIPGMRPANFESWRAIAVGLIESALGVGHPIATRLDAVENIRGGLHTGGDLYPGVARAEGLIKAAMTEIAAASPPQQNFPTAHLDPGLWARVERMIASDDWENVAASAVTYVEDWMRTHAGNPPNRSGGRLVGEGLYAQVLGPDSPLRLGEEAGEWQGWMKLGMGLAQAVGNVDRHRLQQRNDVQTYVMGVLGLCSLLLAQMKHQHPAGLLES